MTRSRMQRWLFGTTLLCASALAADAPPALFVRGGFNGWGTDNALVEVGKGRYEAKIVISPGNHGFKIGSRDWSAEWVINPQASVSVATGAVYPMDTHAGPEDTLFVKTTGAYTFHLDLTDPARPQLQVTRAQAPATVQADPHRGHAAQASMRFATYDGKEETARFSSAAPNATLRGYTHSTSAGLRDPGPQHVLYQEVATLPRVRSGNLAFDALFALAGTELKQASVRQIRDGNYNGGAPIACDCFETGEKWHYVWTRDLSYAAYLGLALFDPQRVRNSLEFKLSSWRAGVPIAPQVASSSDGLQIVQDTGSGGSWPVSTDRISWALGAQAALATLPAAERAAFAPRALAALSNTIENDRLAAFDPATGLYTGEQSFLDWREQSYAAWVVNDIASLASAKALSTNVAHFMGLTLAAQLSREQGDANRAARYRSWADALKQAINGQLWQPDAGMYSSLTAAHFDGAPQYKYDWLGQSLAIISGVADAQRAASILARYPHGPMGAPVIYPQQPGVPVYHNRAIWPFVTAYGLKAAAQTGNVSVADAAYDTLLRGAALNLSNMENLEWLSGQPLLLDEQHPELIGPVINSKRQLWSVGAYLGMVVEQVFGVHADSDGITLRPFVTSALRRKQFAQSDRISLAGLQLQGRTIDVTLRLPKAEPRDGYYAVQAISVNGKPAGALLGWARLPPHSRIEITLGKLLEGQQAIHRVHANPYEESAAVFGPREPAVTALTRDGAGHAVLTFAAPDTGTVVNVYRNGKLATARVTSGSWTDPEPTARACYSVEAQFAASGNRSHHSAPRCLGAAIEIGVTDARVTSNVAVAPPSARIAAARLQDWGKPGDRFAVDAIHIDTPGRYQLQVKYHNSANQINLGISGGVKWMTLYDSAGKVAAQGAVQLPHARLDKADTPQVYSTPLSATLGAGSYRLTLSDFYNMSYLQNNATFSAAGGIDGPSNRFDIVALRLMETE